MFGISILYGTGVNFINKAVNSFKIHGDNTGIFFLFVNCMWLKWLSPQNPFQSQTLSVINNLDFAAYCSIQIKALLQIFNLWLRSVWSHANFLTSRKIFLFWQIKSSTWAFIPPMLHFGNMKNGRLTVSLKKLNFLSLILKCKPKARWVQTPKQAFSSFPEVCDAVILFY